MAEDNVNEQVVEVEFTVEPNYSGWRLDVYLCEKIRRLSRTRAKRIIERSVVADRKLKPSTLVYPGMKFRLRRVVHDEPADIPDESLLRQVYLDEALLVLDKPAGLPIHPTARYHHGTLVTQLQARHGKDFKADPAHRLDRETSGLLVCTRTTEAGRFVKDAFAHGQVHKEYLGICEGHPPQDEFWVDAPIAEGTELVRIAVRIDAAEGKAAQTRFVVERRFDRQGEPFSLLRAFPRTGRQHQIRVHLKHVGYPLVGDKIYGPDEGIFDRFSKGTLEEEAWRRLRLRRHALHAAAIRFVHPMTKREISFESALPEDLQGWLSDTGC